MSQPMSSEEHRRMENFRYGLQTATPKAYVARILVVLNVMVYVAMVVFGYDPFASGGIEPLMMLIDWGANMGPLTVDTEWWRLLTAAFLHGPIYHIGINMWVLWSEGPLVEKMVGNLGFTVLYFVSALLGSIGSIVVNPEVVSVGASGAIFGVIGAMGMLLVRHRHNLPRSTRTALLKSGGLFVGLNVVLTFQMPEIDWAAHVGGLMAGAAAGAWLGHPFSPESIKGRWRRNIILATAGTLVIIVAALALPNDKLRTLNSLEMIAQGRVCLAIEQDEQNRIDEIVTTQTIPSYEAHQQDIMDGYEKNSEVRLTWQTRLERWRMLAKFLKDPAQRNPVLATIKKQWCPDGTSSARPERQPSDPRTADPAGP
jgi:membrane associated rhomboid family serine protease